MESYFDFIYYYRIFNNDDITLYACHKYHKAHFQMVLFLSEDLTGNFRSAAAVAASHSSILLITRHFDPILNAITTDSVIDFLGIFDIPFQSY